MYIRYISNKTEREREGERETERQRDRETERQREREREGEPGVKKGSLEVEREEFLPDQRNYWVSRFHSGTELGPAID